MFTAKMHSSHRPPSTEIPRDPRSLVPRGSKMAPTIWQFSLYGHSEQRKSQWGRWRYFSPGHIPTMVWKQGKKSLFHEAAQKIFQTIAMLKTIPVTTIAVALVSKYPEDTEFQIVYSNSRCPFEIKDEYLYTNKLLCILKGPFRRDLFHDYHTTSCTRHLGETKTSQWSSGITTWNLCEIQLNTMWKVVEST